MINLRRNNNSANPHTLWELIKATIRAMALRFKSLQSKLRKELVEEYEAKIAFKEDERNNEESYLLKKGISDEIDALNKDLDALFQEGKAIRYASNLARWYNERNKGSKYFLNKFKLDKGKPIMSHLVTKDGLISDNDKILDEAYKFYLNLYKSEPVLLPSDDLDSTHSLSFYDKQVMAEDITIEELQLALKSMRPSSSPGNDGITVKFYLQFWDLNSFQHSLLVGKLSTSQRQG